MSAKLWTFILVFHEEEIYIYIDFFLFFSNLNLNIYLIFVNVHRIRLKALVNWKQAPENRLLQRKIGKEKISKNSVHSHCCQVKSCDFCLFFKSLSFMCANSHFLFFQFFVILLILVLTEVVLILVLSLYHEEVRDKRLSPGNISAFPVRKHFASTSCLSASLSVLSI